MFHDSNSTDRLQPLNTLFNLLSHPYRRQIAIQLCETTPGNEDTLTPADIVGTDEDLAIVTVELLTVHFPKLEDTGYIEWNRETNVIHRGPRFHEIAPVITVLYDHRDVLPTE